MAQNTSHYDLSRIASEGQRLKLFGCVAVSLESRDIGSSRHHPVDTCFHTTGMGNGPLVNNPTRDFDMVENLCRNMHFKDNFPDYQKALERAIEQDAIDLLELLIPAGPAKKTKPLHMACRAGKLESVELLLSAGFSCYLQDDRGFTPLHACSGSRSSQAPLVATLLALSGPKALRMKDHNGFTPLHVAAQMNNLRVMQALLEGGADPAPSVGKSVLQVAQESRSLEAVQLLSDARDVALREQAQQQEARQAKSKKPPREETAADVERIMQVWERFFENAFNRTTVDMSDLDGELDRGGYGAPLPISTSASKSKSRSTALGYDSRGARSTLTDDEPARPGYGREQEVYPSNSSYSQAYAPPAPYERAKKGRGKKGQEDHESDYEAYRAGYAEVGCAEGGRGGDGRTAEGGQRKAAEGKQRQSGGRGDSASAQWLDWFAWIICFAPSEGEGGEGEGGEYFVLHRLTGERAWLTDHVARFLRETLLDCSDWGDFESHMAHALPTTLLEAASRGWATYYEPLSNACRWLSVPTKCLEDALPLGIGEQPEALRAQNMQAEYGMGGEGAWVSADQTCATAWVLVVGQPTSPLSPTYTRGREERGEEREQEEREGEEGPWMSSKLSESPLACVDDKDYWGEGGGDGDGDGVGSWDGAGAGAGAGAGVDETVYYYRNWVTGETRWVPPEGWEDLVCVLLYVMCYTSPRFTLMSTPHFCRWSSGRAGLCAARRKVRRSSGTTSRAASPAGWRKPEGASTYNKHLCKQIYKHVLKCI